jgi:hypothetical protein
MSLTHSLKMSYILKLNRHTWPLLFLKTVFVSSMFFYLNIISSHFSPYVQRPRPHPLPIYIYTYIHTCTFMSLTHSLKRQCTEKKQTRNRKYTKQFKWQDQCRIHVKDILANLNGFFGVGFIKFSP